jgi:hypothetical protein
MKPLKAFIYQDQTAHITTHQAFMQDPQVAAMIGQNPQAQAMMAALQAHIAEHFAFKYREQIEQQLGAPLPYYKEDDENQMPRDVEVQISRAVAQAAQQLTTLNMAQAQQKEAQQKAEDPIIQMQQQELALKAEEQKRKAAKDMSDAELKKMEIEVHRQLETDRLTLDAQKLGAQTAYDKDKLDRDSEIRGAKMGMDSAKSREQFDVQRGQIAAQLIGAEINKQGKKETK